MANKPCELAFNLVNIIFGSCTLCSSIQSFDLWTILLPHQKITSTVFGYFSDTTQKDMITWVLVVFTLESLLNWNVSKVWVCGAQRDYRIAQDESNQCDPAPSSRWDHTSWFRLPVSLKLLRIGKYSARTFRNRRRLWLEPTTLASSVKGPNHLTIDNFVSVS